VLLLMCALTQLTTPQNKAFEPSQKYKEGKYILEQQKVMLGEA
jgi:hypothetical protein